MLKDLWKSKKKQVKNLKNVFCLPQTKSKICDTEL